MSVRSKINHFHVIKIILEKNYEKYYDIKQL